jgi:hypothetical protein
MVRPSSSRRTCTALEAVVIAVHQRIGNRFAVGAHVYLGYRHAKQPHLYLSFSGL